MGSDIDEDPKFWVFPRTPPIQQVPGYGVAVSMEFEEDVVVVVDVREGSPISAELEGFETAAHTFTANEIGLLIAPDLDEEIGEMPLPRGRGPHMVAAQVGSDSDTGLKRIDFIVWPNSDS
ncbi:hypothetical protein D1871_07995 [Nakamurella silvestris]|nr:hypothetical protein D1871_07995 [Nakamurella silvestris]